MTGSGPKADLQHYLQSAREAMLWKLDGLSGYDMRRPLTPTGTNLLGLVKHLGACELGYLGTVFGRPSDERQPWFDDDAEPDADLWARADEPAADVVAFYRRVWAHSDATIAALELDAVGEVASLPAELRAMTLHRALVHMIAETHRHAGHADLLRELIDGSAGLREDHDNLTPRDAQRWPEHRDRLERLARQAGPGDDGPGG
ncbi:MAG: DinB family protein [Pseudonocardia sp.]|nr:DinB family protein [Pseudonocardia sp.]